VVLLLEGIPVSRGAIVGMLPGDRYHMAAEVRDANGAAVPGARATLVSRNPAAISLDSAGLLTVVGRGSSWLVGGYISATRGLLADSVTVAVVCTTEARAGIVLTVSDSLTGAAAGLTSLALVARSGNYRDSTFFPAVPAGQPALVWGLAYERPGTYDVRVSADGYQPWVRLGVTVTNDLCHVVPVQITVRLQKP
jgi:hypothetical protein